MTGDVDVTAFLDPDDPAAFAAAMEAAGFEMRVRDLLGFVARTRVVPLVHAATGLALDVVLGGPGLEEEFVRGAREVDLAGVRVPVIGPEDLIVTKVLAGRPKDLEDVRGILQAQGDGLSAERVRRLLRLLESATDRSDLVSSFDQCMRAARRGS